MDLFLLYGMDYWKDGGKGKTEGRRPEGRGAANDLQHKFAPLLLFLLVPTLHPNFQPNHVSEYL